MTTRRLYVLPKTTYQAQTALFHPQAGAHYIDLPSGYVLLCTSFEHSEYNEDQFHALSDVAILPHPAVHGTLTLNAHTSNTPYKFTSTHLTAITGHATLGATSNDTVVTLARKAQAIHPLVKLRVTL